MALDAPSASEFDSEDIQTLESSVQELQSQVRELHDGLKSVVASLTSDFYRLDKQHETLANLTGKHDKLDKMCRKLESSGVDQTAVTPLRVSLDKLCASIGQFRASRPVTHSLFLRLMLGHVNVRVFHPKEREKLKLEYQKFKARTTILFIGFPLLHLIVTGEQVKYSLSLIHQIWLLYYYTSLALRENILQANGSNIKSWWIYHHYLSMGISIITLLFPREGIYDVYLQYANLFLLFQGFVMILQANYQKRRSYTRSSLGKEKDIDIASSETLNEKPVNLRILVPLLFSTYCCEFGGGVFLVQWYFSGGHWHGLISGCLWVVISIGNVLTTGKVLRRQSRSRRERRQSSHSD